MKLQNQNNSELPFPPVLDNTEYPTMRVMRRIDIRSSPEAAPLHFDFDEAHKILGRLRENDPFQKIIETAVGKALTELKADGALVPEAPVQYKTAEPGARRVLRIIFDFKEFAFRLNGALILARGSINLNTHSEFFAQPEKDGARQNLSSAKFGARFVLVEHPASKNQDKQAYNLSRPVMKEFEQQCSVIADRIFEDMSGAVGPFVGKTLGTKEPIIENKEEISIFAVGTRDRSFGQLIDATQHGERLRDHVASNAAAHNLVGVAHDILNPEAGKTSAADMMSFFQQPDRKYIVLNEYPLVPIRGLFLADVGSQRLRFVGLTDERIIPDGQNVPSSQRASSSLMDTYSVHL